MTPKRCLGARHLFDALGRSYRMRMHESFAEIDHCERQRRKHWTEDEKAGRVWLRPEAVPLAAGGDAGFRRAGVNRAKLDAKREVRRAAR